MVKCNSTRRLLIIEFERRAHQSSRNAPQGWELKFNTIASSFSCSDGSLVYGKCWGHSFWFNLDLEVLSEDGSTSYGYLYCHQQPATFSWLQLYEWSVQRKVLLWNGFFGRSAASIKGSCNMLNYTGNDDENYIEYNCLWCGNSKKMEYLKYEITRNFYIQMRVKLHHQKLESTKIDEVPSRCTMASFMP